jgi:hypothetical protein
LEAFDSNIDDKWPYSVKLEFHSVPEFVHLRDNHAKELIGYWDLIFKQGQAAKKRKLEALIPARFPQLHGRREMLAPKARKL